MDRQQSSRPRPGLWRANGTRLNKRHLRRAGNLHPERILVRLMYEKLLMSCHQCYARWGYALPLQGDTVSAWWQCPNGCNREAGAPAPPSARP
jgi:hypothetical protein